MPENTQVLAEGGALTQEQVARILLQPLTAQSIFLASGVRVFDSPGGNALRIPRLTGGPTASFVAEGANIPESDAAFGELKLLPKTLQAVKVISRFSDELVRQSSAATVGIDSVMQAQLVGAVAETLDRQLIAGTTTDGTRPTGLLSYTGTQSIAVGGALTFDVMYDAITALLTANVPPAGARWLITPFVFGALRKQKSTDGKYLMEPDPTEAGAFRALGFPVTVTPRIPTTGTTTKVTQAVLWVPSLVAVARDLNATVKLLRELYAASGQVGIRAEVRLDAAPMYPESIVRLTGVTGG